MVRHTGASPAAAASSSLRPIPSTPRASTSRRAPSRSFWAVSVALLAAASSLGVVHAAAFEPPGNQVLFGAWLDTQEGYLDKPALMNARLGLNVPVYQIAQLIPLPKYNYTTGAGGAAPENLIELSDTDAAVYLTVYPNQGFDAVTATDYAALAQQILDYHVLLNRTVFLRYAPEFQGRWNLYGNQPAQFIASYRTMYTAIKSAAPDTIMVWAPNTPQGYPYGQTLTEDNTAADQALLDTNNDGQLTAADDALAPYWPGDDVVDWVGLSLYYKGPAQSDRINVAQTATYCDLAINGTNPADGSTISNWYTDYCAAKPNVACMLAESGAAFHVDDVNTAGSVATALQIQTAWINNCITSATFLDAFPRLKLIMQFEYEKVETANINNQDDLRDYRITNDTAILSVFKAALAQPTIATRFSWANFRAQPTSISSAGAPPPQTNSVGSTIVQAITATTRARPTTFPSLFGSTSDARSLRGQLLELGALIVSGVAGAYVVMRMV